MRLYYREFGSYSEQHPTLILLHGLLGSSSNWLSIAKGLAQRFHVLVPDLRNHGRSPHDADVSYPALARDVEQLIDEQGLDSALLIGHSMGGKAAMWLALQQPGRVDGLVVVDIAPVPYPNRFDQIYTALHAVEQRHIGSRSDADAVLAQYLDDVGLRQFLLQNLHRVEGDWVWRMNLAGLTEGMSGIVDFPLLNQPVYAGPTLFIYGGQSDYIKPSAHPVIEQLFPRAEMEVIPSAGHWVYAEQPKTFSELLMDFLAAF